MSTTCHQYAIPFLCYFTFPLCDPTVEEPRPRQVCRDECEELEQHICEKEYRLGMNHPDIGKAPATTAVKNRGGHSNFWMVNADQFKFCIAILIFWELDGIILQLRWVTISGIASRLKWKFCQNREVEDFYPTLLKSNADYYNILMFNLVEKKSSILWFV